MFLTQDAAPKEEDAVPMIEAAWKTTPALGALALTAILSLGACAPVVVAGAAGAGVAAATQERGPSAVVSDAAIRIEINHLWFQASEKLYLRVQLQVQEGRVLLSGVMPDPETRVEAVRLAWQAEGVKEVSNEIEVDDDSSLTDRARDVRISTQLKSRLLFDKEISSLNYSIEVVNQSIYLIGVAQDQTELDRVINHAKQIPYVRRVLSYVRLKDDPARAS